MSGVPSREISVLVSTRVCTGAESRSTPEPISGDTPMMVTGASFAVGSLSPTCVCASAGPLASRTVIGKISRFNECFLPAGDTNCARPQTHSECFGAADRLSNRHAPGKLAHGDVCDLGIGLGVDHGDCIRASAGDVELLPVRGDGHVPGALA